MPSLDEVMHDIGHLYQYIVMHKDATLNQHGDVTTPEEDMKQLGKIVDAYFCDAYGVTSGQRKYGTFVHGVQRHARMSTRVRWFGILHGYLDARLYQVDLATSNASVMGAIGLLCNLLSALVPSPEDIGRTFMEKMALSKATTNGTSRTYCQRTDMEMRRY